MRAAVYGGRTPFLRVSRCPVFCLGESSARRKESQLTSQPSQRARSALSLTSSPSQIVRCSRPAARVSALLHPISILPTCSGIVKACHEFITSEPAHARRCHPRHTRYCHQHAHSSKHPRRSTHARRTTPKAQPLSFNVPPAQYLWGKWCPDVALAS